MNDSLSISLRPRSLDDVFGQEQTVQAIRNQVSSGRLPTAWLFQGQSGCGKTTMAKIIALSMQYDLPVFGQLGPEHWAEYDSFNIDIKNSSEQTGVDTARELISLSHHHPMNGKNRVFVLEEAHRMSKNAQDALLIPTERPNSSTRWIFCTTEPDKLIPTLRNRCASATYTVRTLTPSEIPNLLRWAAAKMNLQIDQELAAKLNDFCGFAGAANLTAPRDILQAFEKILAGTDPQEAVTGVDRTVDTRKLCQAVVRMDWSTVQAGLQTMSGEDIRNFRYALLGYLKAIVAKGSPQSSWAADAILWFSSEPPYEDSVLSAWMTAKLYKLFPQRS